MRSVHRALGLASGGSTLFEDGSLELIHPLDDDQCPVAPARTLIERHRVTLGHGGHRLDGEPARTVVFEALKRYRAALAESPEAPASLSLNTFLQKGTLAGISVGSPQAEVHRVFGEPDAVGPMSRRRRPTIWKYGVIEFHFDPTTHQVALIHLDHIDVPTGGKAVSLDTWILRGGMSWSELVDGLTGVGMGFVEAAPREPGVRRLKLDSDVELLVDDSRGLCAVSLSA